MTGSGSTLSRRATHRTFDMRSGSTNSMTSSISDVRQSEMTFSITVLSVRSAVRHVEMSHRVIAVAGQIVGELRRNALLARQADDRAAPKRAALQGARQRKSPGRSVREKRYDADRPEQENVATRKIVAHPPAENARSQYQEGSAPGAQARCAPDRPTPSAEWGCRASAPALPRRTVWRRKIAAAMV